MAVCLTVRQTGNAVEPKTTIVLSVPEGATVTRATEGGTSADARFKVELVSDQFEKPIEEDESTQQY